MGCGSSKPDETNNPSKKVKLLEQFSLQNQDLVGLNTGMISNDYTLLNPPLGKGAFGEVRKAIHKITGQQRAIKMIKKKLAKQEELDKLINEVNMLKKLDHPNIIKVYEYYQDNNYFYIVTDLCVGGELFEKIIATKSFTERQAADTMKQLLSAISYMHENNIVHRDLKPENVLYDNKHAGSVIKVVDFGTSWMIDRNIKMDQKIGTPYYIAPEILDDQYDEKCDVWSLGVMLYILLCGCIKIQFQFQFLQLAPPFNGTNDTEILKSVRKGVANYDEEEWVGISKQAKDLISKMIVKDPKIRISAIEALNDEWIQTSKRQQVDIPTLKKTLENLKKFRVTKKLQEAAFMYMVNFMASKEEKYELLKQFQSLDTNGDGKLSRDELLKGYLKISTQTEAESQAEAEKEVDSIINKVDKNNNGTINYSEFVLATINPESLLENQRLEIAFKMLDKDGDQTISTQELKNIFGRNNLVAESVWTDLLAEVDSDKNGILNYDEFKDMMIKMIDEKKIVNEEKIVDDKKIV